MLWKKKKDAEFQTILQLWNTSIRTERFEKDLL